MKKRRLALLALVTLGLAPGTLVRTTIPEMADGDLSLTPVTELPAARSHHGVTREGVWELDSTRLDFGGYSAMLVLRDGQVLRAFSDRGRRLTFAAPFGTYPQEPRFASVWNRGRLSNTFADIEAATRDPETGDYWLTFENTHSLTRYSVSSDFEELAQPPEWQGWNSNSGAEALERLPDGRFLVLPENGKTGLLYPSDPVAGGEPLVFTPRMPEGYYPTDMAALPDGRVLVLLRNVVRALPPFSSALAIASPDTLAESGDTLELEQILLLETILPRENYEALAVAEVKEDGSVDLWLMSDDNLSAIQRSLLARINWREVTAEAQTASAQQKAREE
ncbi:esterase-like activity of phytase family protein [Aurantiacibacter poecillastricola]|uniref:esterase-like activity of phytase family protein n=1 Tax=Aurantiacibacter poecillastricola TaxID=3064385 RepID=UPI00273F110D|nr:esterase-like activity of phytase family protein [Aurantiacibacter sp. 219JJ12-13]MDP5260566.1 esterase-like activity of phytase family protein [Aurantiacibacter sp. 219JJ12-13]